MGSVNGGNKITVNLEIFNVKYSQSGMLVHKMTYCIINDNTVIV